MARDPIEPFESVLRIIDALPEVPPDDEPLRMLLPGIWPELGDLRALVERYGTQQIEEHAGD